MSQTPATNYAQRVADRLRELRRDAGLSIDDLQARVLEHSGELVKINTLYCWERGKAHGGSEMPLRMLPVFAAIFGYATPTGWLPRE